MSDATHTKLFSFWELVDEFLNAVLFVLIGIVILQVSIEITFVIAGIISIPLVLLVRFISISIPIKFFKIKKTFTNGIEKIMTWGGLRGGISIALALSLPDSIPSETKNLILTATYLIVIFSIVVQGLTIKSLIQKNIS
jgi:CPA1 family monovalent cation:H+ antiporter